MIRAILFLYRSVIESLTQYLLALMLSERVVIFIVILFSYCWVILQTIDGQGDRACRDGSASEGVEEDCFGFGRSLWW